MKIQLWFDSDKWSDFQIATRERMQQSNSAAHNVTVNIITFRNLSLSFLIVILYRKTNSIVCFFPVLLNLVLPQQALHMCSLICLLFCFVDQKWGLVAFCLGEIRSSCKAPQMQPAASHFTVRQGLAPHLSHWQVPMPRSTGSQRSPGPCSIRQPYTPVI